jgi:hypothetical protein
LMSEGAAASSFFDRSVQRNRSSTGVRNVRYRTSDPLACRLR